MRDAGFQHLAAHPEDWAGAYVAVLRLISLAPDQATAASPTASHGRSWYDDRENGNAESLMRDDIPIITGELVDEEALARAAVDIRFAFGTRTRPLFRMITRHLARVRGATPDVIADVGHVIVYEAEATAGYIRAQSGVATARR